VVQEIKLRSASFVLQVAAVSAAVALVCSALILFDSFKGNTATVLSEKQAGVEELMEKLQKMSPEELREFQKKQCIFCQIIAGKMKGKKVYEDDVCFALLDINPAQIGHILLLPKEHYSIMPQIPEEEIKHLGIVSKKLSLAFHPS